MTPSAESGPSAFKRAQLRYRRQWNKPDRSDDLNELIDFSRPEDDSRIIFIEAPEGRSMLYGGPLYGIQGYPGFLYAPRALSISVQTKLAYESVSVYCEKPHATNIDGVPPKETKEYMNLDESMWEIWKADNGFGGTPDSISLSGRSTMEKSCSRSRYRSFAKLSWSTMGYQYDWTSRAYQEGAKSPVPSLLSDLATLFAQTSLCIEESDTSIIPPFTASACIVNYYNTKSVMGGHRDDLELALNKPVVSFSMGLAAVFLLGGKSKDDPVVPILVRPGDVMLLGGQSRLSYHGMARTLPNTVKIPMASVKWEAGDDGGEYDGIPDSEYLALQSYLQHHRININVRQVLPDGMSRMST